MLSFPKASPWKKALLLLVVVLVLGLAGCGDGGESEEDKIAETIEASALSTKPRDCRALATLRYVEQAQMLEDTGALETCEYDAKEPENDPKAVAVEAIEIEGARATADVTYTGGAFNGQTLAIGLVKKEGKWKLDEIAGFTRFDHDRLIEAFREEVLETGLGSINPVVVPCVTERLGAMPRAKIEDVVLGGTPLPIEYMIVACQS